MTNTGWNILELSLLTFRTANNSPWSDALATVYRETLDFLPDDIIPALRKRLPLAYDWLPTPKQIHETATELLFGSIPDCAEGLRCFREAFKAYFNNRYNPGFDMEQMLRVLEEGGPEKTYTRGKKFTDPETGKVIEVLKTFVRPPITGNPVNLTLLAAMGGFDRMEKWTPDYLTQQYTALYADACKQTVRRQTTAVMNGEYRFEGGKAKLGAANYAGLLTVSIPDDPHSMIED